MQQLLEHCLILQHIVVSQRLILEIASDTYVLQVANYDGDTPRETRRGVPSIF